MGMGAQEYETFGTPRQTVKSNTSDASTLHTPTTSDAVVSTLSMHDSGKILTLMHALSKSANSLRSRRLMSAEDFTALQRDVASLISLDLSVEQKRQLCEQIYHTHRFMAVLAS